MHRSIIINEQEFTPSENLEHRLTVGGSIGRFQSGLILVTWTDSLLPWIGSLDSSAPKIRSSLHFGEPQPATTTSSVKWKVVQGAHPSPCEYCMLLLSDHLFIPSYYHLVHATRTSSSDFVTSHNNRPALRRNLCDIRPRPTTFSSSIARHKLGGWTFTTLSLLLVLARSSSSSTVVVRASTTFSYVGAALFVGALPSSHEASSFRRAMSTSTTTSRTSDGTITVSPRRETDQSALVVVCHGLGDTAEGFGDGVE